MVVAAAVASGPERVGAETAVAVVVARDRGVGEGAAAAEAEATVGAVRADSPGCRD